MDVLTLSRIQFGLTAAFHYIFPPMTIGLGVLLVAMEGAYLRTKNPVYQQMTRFWVKVFGLIFALGVATGIVMEFQFGTNWSRYSRFVGDVFGSPLAIEGVVAFFLESVFLGLLLFGWDRVKSGTHFFATVMVALGSHLSAVWIVVANSWMHTPAGYTIVGEGASARAEITDFWQMVLNPSSLDRIVHVIFGAWLAGGFLVLAVSAWYLLRNKHLEFARKSLKMALVFCTLSALLQVGSGHASAVGVSRNHPIRLAAYEGHYAELAPARLYLFGWVLEEEERVIGLSVPGMLGLLVSGDPNHELVGLRSCPPEERPPVAAVFQSYHIMVGVGFAMVGLLLLAMFAWWKGRLENKWLLGAMVVSVLAPHIANQAGWFSAEVGRQPYIVNGMLRTSEAFSPILSAQQVLGSIIMFAAIYTCLFALFLVLMAQKIGHGPEEIRPGDEGAKA